MDGWGVPSAPFSWHHGDGSWIRDLRSNIKGRHTKIKGKTEEKVSLIENQGGTDLCEMRGLEG